MITLGVSELAVTVGLQRTHLDGEPYTSPITLWARLSGYLPRYDDSDSADAEIGRWGEFAIGARYAVEHDFQWGTDICRGPTLDQPGLTHPELPWLHARPDFLVIAKNAPLEAKNPRELDPERWGEAGTGDMPGEHACQVIGQLAVCARLYGSERAELAAMARAPRDRRVWAVYSMARDEELEKQLLGRAWQWVETYVLGGRCPPEDGTEDANNTLRRMWAPVDDRVLVAEPADLERYRRLLQTRAAVEEIQGRHNELRQGLQLSMRDATVLTDPGGARLCTWRVGRDGRRRFRVLSNNAIVEDDSP